MPAKCFTCYKIVKENACEIFHDEAIFHPLSEHGVRIIGKRCPRKCNRVLITMRFVKAILILMLTLALAAGWSAKAADVSTGKVAEPAVEHGISPKRCRYW